MPILVIQNSRGQSFRGVELNKKEVDKFIDIPYIIYPAKNFVNSYQSFYTLAKSIIKKKCNIFIGGDHLTSFGTVLSSLIKYGNSFKLLWIDAHADLHSFETSPSKNLHGMVVHMLLNHTFIDIPRLQHNQILYIGLRSTEKEEMDYIKKHKIKYMKSIHVAKIMAFCTDSNVHISLDVDALSQIESTGTPVSDGIPLYKLLKLIDKILLYKECCFDIMEYNPKLGNNKDGDILLLKQYISVIASNHNQY